MSNSLLEAVAAEEPKEDRPRRPMNAFLLYSNDMRPILQAQNQGLSTAELSKMLGEGWKSLPMESKDKYIERAEQIKIEFQATHPDYVYSKLPKKKPQIYTESGERIKRPTNAFLLYNREMRASIQAQHPHFTAPEISRVLGEGWRSLSNEQRQKYVVDAASIKNNFEKAFPDYVYTRTRSRPEPDPAHQKEKKRRKKDPGLPKHPRSAFMFFLEESREAIAKENAGLSLGHISKVASERWSKLTEQEKAPFLEKSNQDKERYAKEREASIAENAHNLGNYGEVSNHQILSYVEDSHH